MPVESVCCKELQGGRVERPTTGLSDRCGYSVVDILDLKFVDVMLWFTCESCAHLIAIACDIIFLCGRIKALYDFLLRKLESFLHNVWNNVLCLSILYPFMT